MNEDSERWVSYDLESVRPDWHKQARCYAVGTDYYFGDEYGGITSSIQVMRRASKLCDVCPVFNLCLRWSLENREEYGVWAGTSGRTRKKVFAQLDNNETTIEEAMEVIINGQGKSAVRPGPGSQPEPEALQAPGTGSGRQGAQGALG